MEFVDTSAPPSAARVLQARERLLATTSAAAVEDLCRRHAVRVLSLFGSAAAPMPAPRDLDVAVGFELGTRGDVVAFGNDLMDFLGLDELDVMDLGRASIVARARALGPGAVAVFESEAGAFARAQMVALGMELETAHLRQFQLRLMAGQ